MENREAIEIISNYEVNGCGYCHQGGNEVADAFNLAIAALEFQENYDQFWEEVKATEMKGEETEIFYSGKVFRI